jgi:hypothetical protein
MGIFGKGEDEAENVAQQDPNMADEAIDKGGQEADQATGGRFENQTDQGMRTAQSRIGQQPQGGYDQDQGSMGQQDQSNMGQDQGDMGQQDQGGYDQSQDQGGQGY